MSAGAADSTTDRPRHIPELDGLRGVAAMMIVLFHYLAQPLSKGSGLLPLSIQKYLMSLEAGVDVFFVLSGFLVGGILLDQRSSGNLLEVFYIRRFLRIMPPYALLLVCYALTLFYWGDAPLPGMSWLIGDRLPGWSYVAYLQNFFMAGHNSFGAMYLAQTWSLAVEEQFYLILPLLVLFVPFRALPYLLGALIVAAPLSRLGLYFLGPSAGMASFVLLPTRWDSLFLGVVAAWLVRDRRTVPRLAAHPGRLYAAFWIGVASCGLLPWLAGGRGSWHATYGYTLIAATVAIFLIVIRLRAAGWIGWCLRTPLLRYFGKISYTLYLFHYPMLGLGFSILLGKEPVLGGITDALVIAGCFAASVLLANTTWITFEAPLIRLGHAFSYGASRRDLVADTAGG